jgi:hypothetical protein
MTPNAESRSTALGEKLNEILEKAGLQPSQWQYKGLPWRGPGQWIDSHREDGQPIEDQRVHLDVFNTTDPKAVERYEAIATLIASGRAKMLAEDVREVNMVAGPGWQIMVRWMERFYRSPDAYETYWQRMDE